MHDIVKWKFTKAEVSSHETGEMFLTIIKELGEINKHDEL